MILKFLSSRLFLIFLFPFILGTLTVFSFQPFNLSYINFLILPILFLLTVYAQKKSKNTYRKKPYLLNLFFIGYLFGVGFFLSGIHWISHSLTFDEIFKFLVPVAIIGLPIFLGLFFGLANLIVGPFLKNNFTSIILFSSSFAFMDYVRAKILSGFPWNIWAYTWSWKPEVLQSLFYIGFFSFNLLCIIVYCSPLLLIFKKRINFFLFFTISLLFFGNYIYGSSIIKKNDKNFTELNLNLENSIYTKIISPSFDLKYNLSNDELSENISNLIKYSDPDKIKKTLFIWPEGAFTGFNFEQIKEYRALFEEAFSDNHLILFGSNTAQESSDGINIFNSLVVVNNKLNIVYQYNKIKLVPFGEFLPYENILNKFGVKKITEGYGSFSKGSTYDTFKYDNLNMLPLICYEIIFPELNPNQKNIIVNISEDAWFGSTIGPSQHFAKAIFRAIENNVYLVRSANKGFSAFVDNKGVVKKLLKPNERGVIELDVPIINNSKKKYKFNLIFFVLLFTCVSTFIIFKKNE
ncbi:MAG: apolipoprotein N-acyltransferase [Pelagibacteraceae bacterium]|nr:apolipoprotein N-acyltransferase [Pelagibacteraceae bacterium]